MASIDVSDLLRQLLFHQGCYCALFQLYTEACFRYIHFSSMSFIAAQVYARSPITLFGTVTCKDGGRIFRIPEGEIHLKPDQAELLLIFVSKGFSHVDNGILHSVASVS
jgi:hypothetical protein